MKRPETVPAGRRPARRQESRAGAAQAGEPIACRTPRSGRPVSAQCSRRCRPRRASRPRLFPRWARVPGVQSTQGREIQKRAGGGLGGLPRPMLQGSGSAPRAPAAIQARGRAARRRRGVAGPLAPESFLHGSAPGGILCAGALARLPRVAPAGPAESPQRPQSRTRAACPRCNPAARAGSGATPEARRGSPVARRGGPKAAQPAVLSPGPCAGPLIGPVSCAPV